MLSLGQKKPRGGDPLEVTKAQGEFPHVSRSGPGSCYFGFMSPGVLSHRKPSQEDWVFLCS